MEGVTKERLIKKCYLGKVFKKSRRGRKIRVIGLRKGGEGRERGKEGGEGRKKNHVHAVFTTFLKFTQGIRSKAEPHPFQMERHGAVPGFFGARKTSGKNYPGERARLRFTSSGF